ncbi:MAG: Gfo/Idh/MocA family oxidoreductase, partial [Candidatus Solibacter usitatus]|nr:Gfo/Idh/MocA family oxidoreductase [Candidatus Solibacter usitatus]
QTAAAVTAAKAAPNDRIAVGMIGCGARAHELMAAIQKHPSAEIVAVADAYKGRVERAIDRTGGRARSFPSYRELLADKSTDAVVVATPDHLHRPIILEALAAGKDVYSEKPLTYRASEGLEIIQAARRGGRIVQVGSQGVSGDVQRTAREWIRSGKLGRITMIRAAYNRNTASGAWIYPIPPDASPKTVDWEAFLGPAPKRPFSLERFFRWRCYEDYSGGIATDLFVHLCTTIHYLMDAKMPAAVAALGQLYRWKESREVPDTINAVLEYPEGFAVNLSSTFNNQLAAESGFQILGTQGSIVIGWNEVTFYPDTAVEDNRWIVESWPRAYEEAYFKDPKVIESELRPRRAGEPQKFKSDGVDPTISHFGNFFSALRSRQPFYEDAAVGHRAAACAHMVNLSAKQRRLVEWDFGADNIRA